MRQTLTNSSDRVINLDALTYAGNANSIPERSDRHVFVHGDIGDSELVRNLLHQYKIDAIINFAAESHVDRSIDQPEVFIETNITGTFRLLSSSLKYWTEEKRSAVDSFRFLHISTDEVYGSLGETGFFTEATPYAPHSPYSASKASSDHLVRAWHHTYGMPTLITNCSNNYGPYQFPEKLIPLMICNAIEGRPLPLYGQGKNIRDWLFVEDHCSAIRKVLQRGKIGETYNIGGNCEETNLQIVKSICGTVNRLLPDLPHRCEDLITFVSDRPGHDHRYAIDASKIKAELGWEPVTKLTQGIEYTVKWYIENPEWVKDVTSGKYLRERLGTLDHKTPGKYSL